MENSPVNQDAKTILIVDDNPQNLQVLGRLLQEKQFEIEFATNGLAALDWIRLRQFDLILLDINMPEMDGFEVCRRIRADKSLNTLPIVFLSADNDRESILKGFELGGQDYVTKPFDSRELAVRVRTHISLKDSVEKLEKLNKSLEDIVNERTRQLSDANVRLGVINEKLMELDKAKSDFLGLISHEIRTPLNGIVLPLQLMKDPLPPEEIKDLLEMVDMSVKRLEVFSLNALLITRLKTKPLEIFPHPINIHAILSETAAEIKQMADQKGSVLKLSLEAAGSTIDAEEDLVRNCIFNIIMNSVGHSEGGIIEVRTSSDDHHLTVEMTDNGPGFPEKVLKMDLEPFTNREELTDKSVSVGLPLAKLIMNAHRGEIILSNNSPRGASVKLKFRRSLAD